MLGTLSIAAGTGIAGWLLQHAYQHMRYSSYEREDAAMLAPGADPEQRRSWLAAIAPQISIQAVAPSTIDALAASGDIDAGLLPARAAGAYARRYNPTLAGEALTWAIGAGVRRVGGEWGDGDSLMLGCVLGATAETPTVLTLVPALGAASLLFIACSHQIGVKTSAMPLAPVISLALIASLAAGAIS